MSMRQTDRQTDRPTDLTVTPRLFDKQTSHRWREHFIVVLMARRLLTLEPFRVNCTETEWLQSDSFILRNIYGAISEKENHADTRHFN